MREGSTIDVAIVALWRLAGGATEVLVTRRPPGRHLGGSWELPGGKVDRGETPQAAARRELAEEVGIRGVALAPLEVALHRYDDRTVRLHAFLGQARPDVAVAHLGVEAHRWMAPAELAGLPLPAANDRITAAIVARLGG